jgi:hypothetical protein
MIQLSRRRRRIPRNVHRFLQPRVFHRAQELSTHSRGDLWVHVSYDLDLHAFMQVAGDVQDGAVCVGVGFDEEGRVIAGGGHLGGQLSTGKTCQDVPSLALIG